MQVVYFRGDTPGTPFVSIIHRFKIIGKLEDVTAIDAGEFADLR